MWIKNNISAPNSSRNHGIMQGQLGKSLEELSSGYQINHAGDDAAGLVTSEEVCHQINGLDQAMKDVNDGISMTRTDEGAFAEIHSIPYRMETLAIQAANGMHSSAARANIERERLQLLDEIDRISTNMDFNQIPLPGTEVPAGPFKSPKKRDDIAPQTGYTQKEETPIARYHIGSKTFKLNKTDFKGVGKVNAPVEYTDKAVWTATTIRSSLGATEDHLEHTHNSLGIAKENMTAYKNGIRDTNTTSEVTGLTSSNIVGWVVQSIQAHSNNLPEIILRLLQV